MRTCESGAQSEYFASARTLSDFLIKCQHPQRRKTRRRRKLGAKPVRGQEDTPIETRIIETRVKSTHKLDRGRALGPKNRKIASKVCFHVRKIVARDGIANWRENGHPEPKPNHDSQEVREHRCIMNVSKKRAMKCPETNQGHRLSQ